MARALAITGIGQVSALGADVSSLASGLREGRRGIGPLTVFAHRGRAQIAAQVAVVPDPPSELPPAEARRCSRSDRLSLAATTEACRMAGLDPADRARAALVVGITTAGMFETEEAYRRWRAGVDPRLRLSRWLGMPLSTVGVVVAQTLGIFGPRATVSTACSSGALAIATAAGMVARGEAPVAVALGIDTLCRLTYAGFDALQALDVEPCRPFDVTRRGLSLGEGAAAVVIEPVERAQARGARVHALLLGAGVTADAHHVTAPHPEGRGALAAFRLALEAAGIPADAIDYVNAHGSATTHNDEVEVRTLREVMGARLPRVPVSSTKSQIGHCLAAAGTIEAVASITALTEGIVPATVGLGVSEPAWSDLDFVPEAGRRAPLGVVASSSYGFGGHNVTLLLARSEFRA